MRTKIAAARIATDAGVPVLLTSLPLADQALAGEYVGTVFNPTGRRRGIRFSWLEHGSDSAGQILIDDGAVAALVDRKASLLPAGVLEVRGQFVAGEVVEIVSVAGEVVARGLVNFDASELPELMGRSTRELAAELGTSYEREVVHRDELVMVRRVASQ
jgi:glutamate 5-kinase